MKQFETKIKQVTKRKQKEISQKVNQKHTTHKIKKINSSLLLSVHRALGNLVAKNSALVTFNNGIRPRRRRGVAEIVRLSGVVVVIVVVVVALIIIAIVVVAVIKFPIVSATPATATVLPIRLVSLLLLLLQSWRKTAGNDSGRGQNLAL